ncbi:kynurenine 3-monooxygenase-like [Tigriopus californicus]|nr:kynurenine 3-monooxygenase-like [Tigriopus californicus]
MSDKKEKAVIVGGGLVGALEACFLAKRGVEVHLYEYRDDIRNMEHVAGKSINLSLSVRGRAALAHLGLDLHLTQDYGIPMRARMIHPIQGHTYAVPYGKEDQCIYSVGRRYLNELLLDAGEKFPNLHYHFNYKLTYLDVESGEMVFQSHDVEHKIQSDMVLGCDGAFSNVRKALMRKTRFDFSQEYIPHAYLELCIPPTQGGEFAMPPNYLHIWPRGNFMMIALPNQDKSFTVTLFMPFETFDAITDDTSLLDFFLANFPDSIPLIGQARLIEDYFNIKPSPLVSIKCSPYNYQDKVLILGDAAHAMVPFYGQGMNCGMEDVLILDQYLDKYPQSRLKAFEEYSRTRNIDAKAMCDLAMYNYIEMRDLVAKPSFWIRKRLDSFLHWLMPTSWVPLYTSVTFSRMRYHQCIANRNWQDQTLSGLASVFLCLSGGSVVALCVLSAFVRNPHWLERLQWLREPLAVFPQRVLR